MAITDIEQKAAPGPGAVLQARWRGVSKSGDGVGGYYERLMLDPVEVGVTGAVMPRFLLMDLQLRALLRYFDAREGDILDLLLTHVDVSGFAMFSIVGRAERAAASAGGPATVATSGEAIGERELPDPYTREAGRRIAREVHGLGGWGSEDDPMVQEMADDFASSRAAGEEPELPQ